MTTTAFAYLNPSFKSALRAASAERGIAQGALAVVAGFPTPQQFSGITNIPFSAHGRNVERLRALARLIGFEGEPWHVYSDAEWAEFVKSTAPSKRSDLQAAGRRARGRR